MLCILHYTLSQANPEGSLKQASDAMLAMIASEPADFVAVGERLAQGHSGSDTETRERLLRHMHALAEAAAASGPLNVALKSSFEIRFRAFATEARSLLHQK
jgi:hypothetical protein